MKNPRTTRSLWHHAVHDIVEWDVPNWAVVLHYWPQHTVHDLSSVDAWEVGSRHGGLSLWMALHGAHVWCTDVGGPSQTAREKHVAYNVSHLIEYEDVDALHMPYCERFDVVLFKSVLGGIGRDNRQDRQQKAVTEMYHSLKPGGELWFAENLVASPLHRLLRKRWVSWGTSWRYVTVAEMLGFLARFSSVDYTTVGFLGALGRNARQRTLLGRLDRFGLDRLVPETWRYIIVGIARK